MAATLISAKNPVQQWEATWEEYIEARAALDATFPNRFRRGHQRHHNNNKTRLRRAILALRKLDAEFCDRLGIL